MSDTITHNGQNIIVMQDHETPKNQCEAGDYFIECDYGEYYAGTWDGMESHPLSDAFETQQEAIDAAIEATEQV